MRARLVAMLAVVALIVAACGGGEEAGTTTPPTADTPDPATETTASEPSETPGQPSDDGSTDGLSLSVSDGWQATVIGTGVKPILALDGDQQPAIAYLLEDLNGFIKFAAAADGWAENTIVDGYFYGPIGLDFDQAGTPWVAYHDHQDLAFDQALGDLTVATREGDDWAIEAISNEGHDGWDSTITIGADGVVRAAGVDPQQFDRQPGVEYFELGSSGWEVTEIGSGPIAYEFNVDLAQAGSGEPALTYYDNNLQQLTYAERSDGAWALQVIDDEGDVGRYSSLAFDSAGTAHVTSYRLDGGTEGAIRYSTSTGDGAWTTEDVALVSNVLTGFEGARRISDVQIASDDSPHVVYSDETGVWYATRGDGGWESTQIVTAGDKRLGQLVSFELDSSDRPHIAFHEVDGNGPLTGTVVYLTSG